jgi:heat shock protein beta
LEDKTNRKKLASLSRWHSTRKSSGLISFDDYIKKMKKEQDQIYFFSGEDRKILEKSPLVVGLVRKGYEVLLCDDPIDEYVFNVLREYEGKVDRFLYSLLSMSEREISRCLMTERERERFRNS